MKAHGAARGIIARDSANLQTEAVLGLQHDGQLPTVERAGTQSGLVEGDC